MFGLKIVKQSLLKEKEKSIKDLTSVNTSLKAVVDKRNATIESLKDENGKLNKTLKDSLATLAKKNNDYDSLKETAVKYRDANKKLAKDASETLKDNAAMRIYIENLAGQIKELEATISGNLLPNGLELCPECYERLKSDLREVAIEDEPSNEDIAPVSEEYANLPVEEKVTQKGYPKKKYKNRKKKNNV